MSNIRFANMDALVVFSSMLEGMLEVQEDEARGGDTESVQRRDALTRIERSLFGLVSILEIDMINALCRDDNNGDNSLWPSSMSILDNDAEEARAVVENIMDNQTPDDEIQIGDDDITITD